MLVANLVKRAVREGWTRWSNSRSGYKELIRAISSGEDLTSDYVQGLAASVEDAVSNPTVDKVGIHWRIGEAIFARSAKLYSGEGLPKHLVRYTYPPFVSIALSTHCNATCFFCREDDYKGSSIVFDNVFKLESAIRNARTIDLTGWGEPFLYPRLEDVVSYICSINKTKQLIQVTSNGSLLSEKWGTMLSGRLNRLVVSLNAATADTYAEQMRYKQERFTLESTLANIKAFQSQLTDEDRERIYLHMVANTGNFREISDMVRLAATLQVPHVNVGHYICNQKEHADKTLWHVKAEYNAELARARDLGRKLDVNVYGREFFQGEKEVKGAENCMAPFEQFFIKMPGTTAPCCFMGHEQTGNVYEDGFETVWFSDLMNKLRKKRFLPPCQVCVVHTPFDSEITHTSALLLTQPVVPKVVAHPRVSKVQS